MSTTAANRFSITLTHDELQREFRALADEWIERGKYLSNNVQLALIPAYQQIIGLGRPAVPLILEELRREPRQWFWALEQITRQDPVPAEARGNVRKMADAWVTWGQQQGLIG
jgi:hypothetical protein